jgi:hypothetical protein
MENHKNSPENNPNNIINETEEIAYETRFLLNVLLDLLVKKKLITEEEFSKEYNEILAKINKSGTPSNN